MGFPRIILMFFLFILLLPPRAKITATTKINPIALLYLLRSLLQNQFLHYSILDK